MPPPTIATSRRGTAELARQERTHPVAAESETRTGDGRADQKLAPRRAGGPANDLERFARRGNAPPAGDLGDGEEALQGAKTVRSVAHGGSPDPVAQRWSVEHVRAGRRAGSAGVELDLFGHALAHLERGREVRVAHDDVAVADQGLLPVAALRADRRQVDLDDVAAELGEQLLEPDDALDAALAPARA